MVNRLLVLLLFCYFLVDGSVEATFSSKLVHRYSEEAKERWVLKSGNVSVVDLWPKKDSVEYLELLLSNDWKRHRMRVESRNNKSEYQLLFPSQGSQTHFFGNQFYWLHYTWIDIGTPNVSFLVALDAGSNLLWVPCKCIQCAPLSASYYTSLDRNLSEYDPSLSSSSKNVSCSHRLCKSRLNCKTWKDPCPYIAEYSSEDTTSSGYLVEDILHLASSSKHAPQNSVQASVIIGKQEVIWMEQPLTGLMGLGLGDISVPSFLAKSGLIQNSFSICFDENDSGRIFFGDQGPASQQSTPFLPIGEKYDTYFVEVESYCVGSTCLQQSGFQALVDSGASFTYLPNDIYDKVVLKFDKLVKAERISLQGNSWKYCYNASSKEILNIPDMKLIFTTNQSFVVHNHIYSFPESEGFTVFCLTIMAADGDYGIIGQNFMMGHHMVFDRENLKLGWSHSKCDDGSDKTHVHAAPPPGGGSPNSLPTNQQSTTNSHAVAPATAKRTSSKSSASEALELHIFLHLISFVAPLHVFLFSFI
ncbi:aspartic proteinase-like protein 1 [Melia azedarach]|uniref:Aspartic proteinase-like protein 1 n=1 Tax=Melia azedarach TaxID=155640 RepID=A0ACC1WQH5_MELAZ|nr:aspartic proteinase-like protein 1 [Melia azedarach]